MLSEKKSDELRLTPQGDLVASTVEEHRACMMKALETPGEKVVLDLSAVELIDSLGITLVLGLFKSCQKAGTAFAVESVKPDIMRVFRLFNLTKFFSVSEA
jgi:anti-sigma B factor antagonist